MEKLIGKAIGIIGTIIFLWAIWGDGIVERFPMVSRICEKIGLDLCTSAEAMQEDEVLIEDEPVEI